MLAARRDAGLATQVSACYRLRMPQPNVQVRLTQREKRRVEAAAKQDSVTVSEWLRVLMRREIDEADSVSGRRPRQEAKSEEHRPGVGGGRKAGI